MAWANGLVESDLHAPGNLVAKELELLDYFIQASAESPEEFARIFRHALGPDILNPLSPAGSGALHSLVANACYDDWELFLAWREEGYIVVPENQRQPSDARFGPEQALRLLDIVCGGRRAPPGEAIEERWVQAFHELPHADKRRP
jgi:hypothetical protein